MAKAIPVKAIFDGLLKVHREIRLSKQAQATQVRADKRLQIAEETHNEKKRYFGRTIN